MFDAWRLRYRKTVCDVVKRTSEVEMLNKLLDLEFARR